MSTNQNDRIESAKEHIAQALDDIKRYCSEDIALQSKDITDEIEKKVLSGIDTAADTIIETLFKFKKVVKKAQQKDEAE